MRGLPGVRRRAARAEARPARQFHRLFELSGLSVHPRLAIDNGEENGDIKTLEISRHTGQLGGVQDLCGLRQILLAPNGSEFTGF